MTPNQLQQYDLFLDENDWDIYYWATQEPTPTSMATADGGDPKFAASNYEAGKSPEGKAPEKKAPDGGPMSQTDGWRVGKPRSGEWAQTVGTFKPAYRPVPARWKNSEVLRMLRQHVVSRSAGGVLEADGKEGRGDVSGVIGGGGGLGFMPELKNFDQ